MLGMLRHPFLGEITGPAYLILFASTSFDHEYNPQNEGYNTKGNTDYPANHGQPVEHRIGYRDYPEDNDRLDGMEANKITFPLQQDKDDATYPAKDIAEQPSRIFR